MGDREAEIGVEMRTLMNYEKIAAEVEMKKELEDFCGSNPAPAEPPIDSSVQGSAAREYLPLDHQKYQGIGEAKGYAQGDDFSGNRLQRVHNVHEAIIDFMIANPTAKQSEIATQFGKSQGWISIMIGSDAFQGALAKRRDDLSNPELVATLEERYRGLADQSLQILAEKLESTRNTDLALKSLEISGKALGFGARNSGPVTNNNFVVALPGKIADANAWAAAHAKDVTPKALPGG